MLQLSSLIERAVHPTPAVVTCGLVATAVGSSLGDAATVIAGLVATAAIAIVVHRLQAAQTRAAEQADAVVNELRESESRFRSAFDDAAIGMALVALGGGWLRVNRALCNMLGYSEAELLERSFQDLTHPNDLVADIDLTKAVLAGERATYQLEKRYFSKTGELVWGLLCVSLVRDEAGRPLYFVSQIQDITARKRMEEELRHRVRHDGLTGLATGGVLREQLDQCFRRAQRWKDYHFGVLFIDLNGFKEVNDTLGHDAGDEVLRQVAKRLQSSLRETDSIAREAQPLASRMGGDEFVVLLDRLADPGDAQALADRLAATLARPYVLSSSQTVRCSASIGVAVNSDEYADADAMLRAADAGMYAAKRSGVRDAA